MRSKLRGMYPSRIMDTLEEAHLARHFERIGARLQIERAEDAPRSRGRVMEPFTLDANEGDRGSREDAYVSRVRPQVYPDICFAVLDVRPKMRHLLLMARPLDGVPDAKERSRFLCGHDERHWFVAAVKNGQDAPTGVNEAMESLKPAGIARLQHRMGVSAHLWNRRKNPAFQRQGEWFFVLEDA